ncbi:NAD(P)/FAD-dependent oxidoreductase [Atribacter laminatus]|uniref:Hydrogen cyanide synthase subunit HcnC n=1 Tax=Atribacter laminatus TaxID=2847778 RepID=A0A7T1AK94_ATRLM|nr:NAD(P)/FAD-dependent oxidoreductase [Atribacter laminatus]QPM67475.1 Hydrogen cyanide synthase subunit HcnC [Atribacter laminatus]
MKKTYDVIIVGGGVVGCAIAWFLSHFDLKTLLLERELDVCCGVSKANTGIIHSGSYLTPGTVKGKLHQGALSWFPKIEKELDFHPSVTGALTVAFNQDDLNYLKSLKKIGRYDDADILSPQESRILEPNLSDRTVATYYDPHAAVVSPFRLTLAFAEGAALNGVEFHFDSSVEGFDLQGKKIIVHTPNENYEASYVVNAAGLSSVKMAQKSGDQVPDLSAFKGEYFLLDKESQGLVKKILYPVPNSVSKGILVSPTPEGNILAGPNFESSCVDDTSTTPQGLNEVRAGAQKLVPRFPFNQTIQIFAGIRPTLPERDFLIFVSKKHPGLIHLCGIESPGLTASPGIAEYVGELLIQQGLSLKEKDQIIFRKAFPVFHDCDWEKREELIAQDPDWGQIVCRCEEVTLAEVKYALNMNPPARTMDGLKRRIRVTAGRCQGSFCQMHLPSIVMNLLNIGIQDLLKSDKNSNLFVGETKKVVNAHATSH